MVAPPFPSLPLKRTRVGDRFLLCCVLLGAGCASTTPQPTHAVSVADESERLFRDGEQALLNGDSVRAEQYLNLAIQAGMAEERALPVLLRACIASARVRAALNYAEPYLRDHPDADSLRYLIATLRLSLGQSKEAARDARALLYRNPQYADAHYLLGILTLDQGGNPSPYFSEYLKLSPHGRHVGEINNRLAEYEVRRASNAEEEPSFRFQHSSEVEVGQP